MADNFLPYQNPSVTDAKLDTESLTVGANTVHRERIQITGTAAADIAPVSASDGVLVNLGANNDVTVTGTVTANAGTNLNTSSLALESGGNLATVAALSKAEDAAHSTGHTGVMLLGVRNDANAARSDTDGVSRRHGGRQCQYAHMVVSIGRRDNRQWRRGRIDWRVTNYIRWQVIALDHGYRT